MEPVFNIAVFVVFVVLWAAFAGALVLSQGSLDQTWEWIRGLPIALQFLVWLLFLPVVGGLWIWETSWPLIARLILVGGLAFANLVAFFPKDQLGGRL